ncbi:hypothetical protein [Duganella sp. BuS-21]|uniref:hypothetical protein n=1 Tax=Duganella sp. BuS-21 TaxID=2943848 RepID=UPI0035A6D8DE
MYEIHKINDLPSISDVLKRAKGLALLDAIIMPDWNFRYFSFNSAWNSADKESMASMRDGSGSEYFIIFSPEGVVGKVLDANFDEDVYDLLEKVPNEFNSFKIEKAFNLKEATFYFWRAKNDMIWNSIPASSKYYSYLNFLAGGVEVYHSWAESYYEKSIDLEALKEAFESLEINEGNLLRLNPELTIEDVVSDLNEILGD